MNPHPMWRPRGPAPRYSLSSAGGAFMLGRVPIINPSITGKELLNLILFHTLSWAYIGGNIELDKF
jgi:hypothetical protein